MPLQELKKISATTKGRGLISQAQLSEAAAPQGVITSGLPAGGGGGGGSGGTAGGGGGANDSTAPQSPLHTTRGDAGILSAGPGCAAARARRAAKRRACFEIWPLLAFEPALTCAGTVGPDSKFRWDVQERPPLHAARKEDASRRLCVPARALTFFVSR